MILLTSVSDLIQVVSGSAGALDVHASWVDNAAGTITPGRTNTPNIATATTTTVVAAPASSTQRNVKGLYITNTHASVSNQVTVNHTDGTNVKELMGVTLLPGENLNMDENGTFHHRDAQGAEYSYQGPPFSNLSVTGVFAETMDRATCDETNSTVPTLSGTLWMQAIYLKAGQVVSNILLHSATTGAGTPTHQIAGLYDSARNLLATSTDKTSNAWAANTMITFPMVTAYRVTVSGVYYIGFFMAATTIITMKGRAARVATQLAGQTPILQGASASTGLTTALPNPAGAITVSTASMWAGVS